VAPSAAPVKKTPDITDIIEVRDERREVRDDEMMRKLDDEMIKKEEEKSLPLASANGNKEMADHWRPMFEQIFASVPTIYIPLKELLPEIENDIIKVTVKNEIQKEHFEAKKREVLEYLRTHYDEKIEDVVVETNEKMETKKIIYDIKDKLLNFKEQNEEFEDFLQILDLTIKD
jgi:hypothetical protein